MYEDLANAINNGDCKAYFDASQYHGVETPFEDFFYYAYFMAEKYDCAYANYDVFRFMTAELTINDASLNLNDKMRTKAIYYLLKAYYLDESVVKSDVNKIFKDGDVPSLSEYKKLMDTYDDSASRE